MKKVLVFEDFLKVLICPNTKEKLSIISRKELTEISRKENVGLKILKRGYCGIETPGSKVPKFLLKRFFDAEKYGLYCYFVCEKPL